jgi:hypothetical protein
VTLKADGDRLVGYGVTSYFGMRKIKVATGRRRCEYGLMLNNEVLFQYGPLDQGWWPDGLYTPAHRRGDEVRHRHDQEVRHEHGAQARQVRMCTLVLLVRQAGTSGLAGHACGGFGTSRREQGQLPHMS